MQAVHTSREGALVKEGKYLCKNLIAKEKRDPFSGGCGNTIICTRTYVTVTRNVN